ncbi:MAG: hypothetical protein P8178_06355 [Candidatus Thiodiazotropha sp.]
MSSCEDQGLLFHSIQKRLALSAGNFGIKTSARLDDSGWINVDLVYTKTFQPLIATAEQICLAGYDPEWAKDIYFDPVGSDWIEILEKNVYKALRQHYLPTEVCLKLDLIDFLGSAIYFCPKS